MNRYRCVVCGKTRNQIFLRKLNKDWVCAIEVKTSNQNLHEINGRFYQISKCEIDYKDDLLRTLFNQVKYYNSTVLQIETKLKAEIVQLNYVGSGATL